MNNKLLIIYLERLQDRLHLEISKADDELGPDAERTELLKPSFSSESKKSLLGIDISVVDAKKFMESFDVEYGDAVALQGLWEFAETIGRDIDALSGPEGLAVDPSVNFK